MVQNIMRAFDYARARGIPFNVYAVINLIETDAHAAATIFEAIRHKYRDWLNYRARKLGVKLPPMYAFTFEAPGNPHVNWVLRVPPSLRAEFLQKLPKWIGKTQQSRPHDLNVQLIEPGGPYKSLANYICKGCDPAFIEHFHLTALHDQHGDQGEFWGKRAGVSPSLNRSARDAAGYDAKRRRFAGSTPARSASAA
ncbi:hypothetical protein [Bradyrhizobium sp. STM 3809]|uniref:hypothetical protein n=1 Tax=Bradyrhizobium sp. STM 3809 TaxID=551936 RepID=UPI0002D5C197|nr:hypothetical protein [Bradyrhizobium sp. STM 3809]